MRARTILTTLCAAIALAGCVKPPSTPSPGSDFGYDEWDSIPNDVPLPKPGVNQRPVVGTKKLLVTVTHWQDGDGLNFPLIKKHTVSNDPDALPAYISAASHGKLTLTGQIIEHTSGPRPELCKEGSPMPISLATAEGAKSALAQGLNPNDYDYLINVIDCGGNASAYVPGRVMGVYGQAGGPHVYKHEFGHNLGYNHASTYTQCATASNVVSAPGSCQTTSYGDTGDSVSGGGTLYPANNRWYSGWLDNSQAAVIERSGLYRLTKLGNEGPQLYLINRPGLTPSQVALEYRKPTPFDNFPPSDNRVKGVWVRYTTMGGSLLNTQLDATPQTATTADPTLLPGKVFSDLAAGVTVEVCSATDTGATVAVTINNQLQRKCPTLPPAVPGVTNPPASVKQYNPVKVAGSAIPGALVNINYKRSADTEWVSTTTIAGADGTWEKSLPYLSPQQYHLSVSQKLDDKTSLPNTRIVEVVH
ncbi:transposase [Pseudomonas sp. C1C7]|uniref:transposase n=1 Tax=Pseudomonas sp. C1C7 TaxID=2735272 RepID=UPI0015867793|nr:transposase [Pseudomonas sp. C1C7]NUT73604.1 transposase [Pseudomonas sp. C1C7]